jgi:Uma2 family endonuclease
LSGAKPDAVKIYAFEVDVLNKGSIMTAKSKEKNRMTPDEYLEFERNSEIRHEYFEGEIFAMTGGSLNHNQISANIVRELGNQLKNSPCRAFASDMRVKVNEIEKYIYPDIVVVCGDIELEKIMGVETLLNPVVIMEILSTSTEAYDRGKKFTHYRLIPTLQEYFLVSQDYCQVEKYIRSDDGGWKYFSYEDMEQFFKIESIEFELPLSEIYYRVVFERA